MTSPFTLHNLQYYTERLADPTLLYSALVTGYGDLAVPVGGTRRGGWASVYDFTEGERLIERMRELPSLFPNPRFSYDGQVVAFGEEEPDDEEAAGYYFGYSDTAIAEFLRRVAEMEKRS